MNTLTPQALQLKPNCDVTRCQATSQISVDPTPGGLVYMNLYSTRAIIKTQCCSKYLTHVYILYVSIMCDIYACIAEGKILGTQQQMQLLQSLCTRMTPEYFIISLFLNFSHMYIRYGDNTVEYVGCNYVSVQAFITCSLSTHIKEYGPVSITVISNALPKPSWLISFLHAGLKRSSVLARARSDTIMKQVSILLCMGTDILQKKLS